MGFWGFGVFDGLRDGFYVVSVTDAQGCVRSTNTIQLSDPDRLSFDTPQLEAPFCNIIDGADNTGRIEVDVLNVRGSLEYTLNSVNQTQTGTTFIRDDLTPGSYTLTVREEFNGEQCQAVTLNFVILEANPIDVTPIITRHAFFDSAADQYIVCEGGTVDLSVLIENGNFPITDIRLTGTTEAGAAFNQLLSGVATDGGTTSFNNLGPGDYTISLTDPQSCSPADVPISIRTANDPVNSFNRVVVGTAAGISYHVSCFRGDNGEIQLRADGEFDNFTFTLRGNNGYVSSPQSVASGDFAVFPNLQATDIIAGSLQQIEYTYSYTNSIGCTYSPTTVIRLDEPDPVVLTAPTLPDENGFNLRCHGDFIDVMIPIVGGAVNNIDDYIVTLSDGTNDYNTSSRSGGNLIFSDLPAGNYDITVSYALGEVCEFIEDPFFTITEPTDLTISEVAASNQSPVCIGHADGTMEVVAGGGVITDDIPGENYRFEIISASLARDILTNNPVSSVFDMTPIITGSNAVFTVPAGDFVVQVTDKNGCTETVNINVPETSNPLTISLLPADVIEPACFGGNDGEITVSASGGNPFPDPGDGSGFGYRFELTGANLTNTVTLYSNTGNSVTFTDLFATINPEGADLDEYKIFVIDQNGCEEVPTSPTNVAFTDINSPSLINLLTETLTQPTCFNGADGILEVRASGGEAPYEFSTDGINFQTSPGGALFSLPNIEGDSLYTIYVRDARFNPAQPVCTISADFFVPAGPRLEITLTPSQVTCFGGDDGEINTFVAFTGNQDASLNTESNSAPADFSYAWRLSGTSTVISTDRDLVNLNAGTYELTVSRNGQPCIGVGEVTITQPDEPFTFESVVTSDASCNGKSDGFVNVRLQGGNTLARVSLQYSLNGGGLQPLFGNTIADLAGGDYNLTVINADGCQADTTFTILELSPIVIVTDSANVSCFGGNNGFVVLSASPAIEGRILENVEYGIDILSDGAGNIIYQSSPAFLGLVEGEYDFYVREASNTGCQGRLAQTITISQPTNDGSGASCNPVIALVESVIDETCEESNDGGLRLLVSGGVSPYNYSWSHDASLNSPVADDLTSGDYTVMVTDAAGAETTVMGTVTTLAPINIIDINVDDVDCFGQGDGSISLLLQGGSGSYDIAWSDGQTGVSATQLVAGTYNVTISDALNDQCFITTDITVEQPDDVSAQVTDIRPTTCNGDADGQLTISISGGSGLFDILWPDGQTGPTASGLAAGVYDVQITDQIGGCILIFPAELPETPAIEIQSSELTIPSCFGESDGSISITLVNARNPFIQWFDQNMNFIAMGSTATGLSAGTYNLQVLDADGCSFTSDFTLSQPDLLEVEEITSILPLCNGDCNGILEANVLGGTAPYQYDWIRNGVSVVSGLGLSRAEGLCSGTYTLRVEDANGCITSQEIILDQPDPLSISNIDRTEPSCNGFLDGSIDITIQGGTGPYDIDWEDGTEGQLLSGIGAGSYRVTIVDQNGCQFEESIELSEPDQLQLTSVELTEPSCAGDSDGSILVTVAGGTEPYNYLWSNGQQNSQATFLAAGDHTVTITDNNGCILERTFSLGEPNTVIIASEILTDPTCFEGTDGMIQIDVQGGSGEYTYSWSTGADTKDITGLSSGEYTVVVEDINGCFVTKSFTLIDPDEEIINTLASSIVLCEGASTELTAGDGWVRYEWQRNGTVFSEEQKVTVSLAGDYILETETDLGCIATKAFTVETGTNILSADFIFDSEIIAGDTVVLVDVSWPIPDRVEWIFPDGVQVLTDSSSFYQEVIFNTPGDFLIGLGGHIGDCFDFIEKTITVIDPDEAGAGGRAGGRVGEVDQNKLEVSLSPNPNDGIFRVLITQDEEEDIKVSLFSFQSAIPVEQRYLENNSVYNVFFDRQDLNSGVYFIVIERGDDRKIVRFILS